MRPRPLALSLLGMLGLLVGCSPPAGEERGACYPNGTCNAGLSCLSNVCVVVSADAGPEDTGTAPVDAANGNDADLDAAGDAGSLGLACDPWTSSCDEGQSCVFDIALARTGGPTGRCQRVGPLAAGAPCAISSSGFAMGLPWMGADVLTTEGGGWCRRLCDPRGAGPCAAGDRCYRIIPGSDETSPRGLCWETCDPSANAWAGDCEHAACVPTWTSTFLCIGDGGTRALGDDCTGDEGAFSCAPGSFCGSSASDPIDAVCTRYCRLGEPCPDAGTTCLPFRDLEPSEVGYCG